MNIEELEQDIREALGPSWVNVRVAEHAKAWLVSINGRYFDFATRAEAMRYLGAFFTKASTMDAPQQPAERQPHVNIPPAGKIGGAQSSTTIHGIRDAGEG